MKRYYRNFLTSVILSALFLTIGCNKIWKNNGELSQKITTKTLTFWEHEDPVISPYLDSIIAEFEKDNPGLKIMRTHYSPMDIDLQFQHASAMGNPADVILTVSDKAGLFSLNGLIIPVDGLFDLTQYLPTVVTEIQQDGKSWGVPNSNGNQLMLYYNKEYVKIPPKTTNELFKLCDQLIQMTTKHNPNKKLTCIEFVDNDPFWLFPFLSSYDGWPIDGHKPTLDTPYMVKALNFMLSFKQKGYSSKNCDYSCMDSMYKDGNTAMILNGDWKISSYLEAMNGNMGVSVLPTNSETGLLMAPSISGKYFLISSNVKGEKLELVKKFINTFNSVKNQIRMEKELKKLPVLKVVYDTIDLKSDPIFGVMAKQIEFGKPMPIAVEMKSIWDVIKLYLEKVMTEKMSAADASKRMQEEVNKKFNEIK